MVGFVKFFIEGICTAFLGLFGIFGNIVSIAVLSSNELDMMPSFRHLMKMLAAFDATFLVFTLSLFCVSAWSDHYNEFIKPWLIPYFLPVIQIALTGSVWTTMAVSVERYLTVCLCYRGPTMSGSSLHRHIFYTLPIAGFSIIFNIPRFFELYTEMQPVNVTNFDPVDERNVTVLTEVPVVAPTKFRQDPGYSRDYVLIANSLALVFIPILALIILNSMIFRTINQATQRHNAISSNQRRDHSVAMMLIFIVVVFVICHSIRSIINTFECIQLALHGRLKNWPDWIQTLVHVNHFALVVNSSINFLIYCCKDDKFFNVMLKTIGLERFQRTSRSDSTNTEVTRVGPTVRSRMSNSTMNNSNANSVNNGNGSLSASNGKVELKQVVCTTANAEDGGVTTSLLVESEKSPNSIQMNGQVQNRDPAKLSPKPSTPPPPTASPSTDERAQAPHAQHATSVTSMTSLSGRPVTKLVVDEGSCEECCCRSCSCAETEDSSNGSTASEGHEGQLEGQGQAAESAVHSQQQQEYTVLIPLKASASTQTPKPRGVLV